MTNEQWQKDHDLVTRCLQREVEAIHEFDEVLATVRSILFTRGGTETLVHDILGDLRVECLFGTDESFPLLRKFGGKSTLLTWLSTVATNRLTDAHRRELFRGDLPQHETDSGTEIDPFDNLPARHRPMEDKSLRQIMLEALTETIAETDPEALLMLQLVHCYDVRQRDLSTFWRWHETKMSRFLSEETKRLADRTLTLVQKKDPQLRLTWEDFLQIAGVLPSLIEEGVLAGDRVMKG